MKQYQVRIDSYFSFPSDLSQELSTLTQFVAGYGYSVELKSEQGSVVTTLVPEEEDDSQRVLITGIGDENLFCMVLGIVVNVMSKNSDSVFVSQC